MKKNQAYIRKESQAHVGSQANVKRVMLISKKRVRLIYEGVNVRILSQTKNVSEHVTNSV